jgi:hypothetical protein
MQPSPAAVGGGVPTGEIGVKYQPSLALAKLNSGHAASLKRKRAASNAWQAAWDRISGITTKSSMSSRYEEGRRGHWRQPGEHKALRPHATDQEIQKWVVRQHGFVPESTWITRCKEEFGLAAPGDALQENPCPPDKVAAIKQAFRHFGLL